MEDSFQNEIQWTCTFLYESFAACPREAISSLDLTLSLKINEAPRIGAIDVPNELNACDKLSLLEAPSSEPNTAT